MQHQSVLAAHSEAHADAASALFVSRADCADPVLLLRAADNSVAALPSDVRTDDGWGRVSKGVLTVLSVSGQHHGLLRALAVQAMGPGPGPWHHGSAIDGWRPAKQRPRACTRPNGVTYAA